MTRFNDMGVPSVPLANWYVIYASSGLTDLTANWHVSRHGMRHNYDQVSDVCYGWTMCQGTIWGDGILYEAGVSDVV